MQLLRETRKKGLVLAFAYLAYTDLPRFVLSYCLLLSSLGTRRECGKLESKRLEVRDGIITLVSKNGPSNVISKLARQDIESSQPHLGLQRSA